MAAAVRGEVESGATGRDILAGLERRGKTSRELPRRPLAAAGAVTSLAGGARGTIAGQNACGPAR